MNELIEQARDWLIDIFPDEEIEIVDATDSLIRKAVETHYDGGWDGFEADRA